MKTIFWSEATRDEEAYNQGKKDCIRLEGDTTVSKNPYSKNTNKWYNWNQGWNHQVDKL